MPERRFVICINNSDYPASLEKRKLYECLPDAQAERHGQLRIIDESGESYLYPEACFIEAPLSDDARAALIDAA